MLSIIKDGGSLKNHGIVGPHPVRNLRGSIRVDGIAKKWVLCALHYTR
jgi:hypothetical protein